MSLSTHQVRERLRERFSAKRGIDRWAFFEEVANGTGARADRRIDAICVELWPSDGYNIHAFEIKTSRADWIKELDNPDKSRVFEDVCDFFWVVVGDKTIVPPEEIPPGWGLVVPSGERLRIAVRAPRLERENPDRIRRPFVMSLLRSASRNSATGEALKASRKKGYEEGLAQLRIQVDIAERERNSLRESIKEFEEASGITIGTWNAGKIGAAVAMVSRTNDWRYSIEEMRRISEKLRAAAEELAVAFPEGGK